MSVSPRHLPSGSHSRKHSSVNRDGVQLLSARAKMRHSRVVLQLRMLIMTLSGLISVRLRICAKLESEQEKMEPSIYASSGC